MKKVMIIGATSDIAMALCHCYAQKGYELLVTGRNQEALTDLSQTLQTTYKINVHSFPLDVENHQEWLDVKMKVEQIGYDGVVVAHGYLGNQAKAQQEKTERDTILNVNFMNTVDILEDCAAYLEQKKSGFLAAISSVAGDRGRQSNYVYGASKGALSVYLQGLRNRLAKSGVHVLTVKPGFVKTKMTEGIVKDGLLVASPEKVARSIEHAIDKRKHTIYTLGSWRFIMWVITCIPEFIFKKLSL